MPIDASIPLKAGQGVNPLSPAQYMQAGLGMANTALANQKMRAQRAAGQDWQKSIVNGQFDPQAFRGNLAGDPNAAFVAPQYTQESLSAAHQHLANSGMSLDQAHQRASYLSNLFGGWLAQNQNAKGASMKDVSGIAMDVMNAGLADPKQTASWMSSFAPLSPKERLTKMRDWYAMAQHTAQAVAPALQGHPNGAGTILTQGNPVAGGYGHVMGYVKNQLSPGEASTPVSFTGPQNQTITETRGAIAANNNRLVMPGQTPQGGGQGAPYVWYGENGQPQAANPLAPGASNAPQNGAYGVPYPGVNQQVQAQPMASNNGVVMGATPGQVTSQTTNAKYNADLGNNWVTQAGNVQQSMAALQGIGAFSQGASPGLLNDALGKISNVMSQLGIKGASNIATNSAITQKETAQLVMSQADKLGVPTDSKMSLTELGTPNMHMTPQAIQTTKGLLMGQFEYLKARSELWQQNAGSMSASKFQTKFNNSVPSADVFQYAYLPPEAQAKYWKSLSKNEKRQFGNALGYLVKSGIANVNGNEINFR